MNRMLLYFGIGLCCLSGGAADWVVRNGAPAAGALLRHGEWEKEDGRLVNSEIHRLLPARDFYRGDRFLVSCRLALEKFEGTAAALVAGEIIWGFDGGEKNGFFVEIPGCEVRSFGRPDGVLPGKPFDVALTGENGEMTLAVNGKEVGRVSYDKGRNLDIHLRPHRSRMSVEKFSIEGTAAESRLAAMPALQIPGLLPLGKAVRVALPYSGLVKPGVCQAKLENVEFPCPVGTDEVAEIPAEILEQAYRAQENRFNTKCLKLTLADRQGGGGILALTVFDPGRRNEFALGRVRRFNGSCGFAIDGEEIGAMTGRLSCSARGNGFQPSAAREFGRLGIHGNIVLLAPWNHLKKGRLDVGAFLAEISEILGRILAEDPEGMMMLQFPLYMDFAWLDAHPEELIVLDNGRETLHNAPGKRRQPSYASEAWRRDAGQVLRDAVEALRNSPMADRIGYLRLNYANCGEWNHWGYHENAFVDYSQPMQRAFGRWLEAKYGTVEALRKAWGDGEVSFRSDRLVPSREVRLAGGEFFRTAGGKTRPVIDYYTFFQEFAADTILHFAKIVKEVSGRRLLTGAYYGYYFGHYGANPYHFQDSGSYAAGRILRSEEIDFIGGPYPYESRRETLILNGLAQSARLHGKVWESEGDQRTHYSGDVNKVYGTTENLSESIAVAKRDFMVNLERGASYYFFDFYQNWYRDPEFMTTVGRLREIDAALRKIPRRDSAQVVVLFSEEAVPLLCNRPEAKGIGGFAAAVRTQLSRLGIPADYYLLSDLDRIDFSGYRVVIFANSYRTDDEMIARIRRYAARGNRTLLFFYAPGILGEDARFDPEQSRKLTGIGLRAEPEKSFDGISSAWSRTRPAPLRPRISIDDAGAAVIARFPDGAPAGAERRFAGYKSVVICDPLPDAVYLRGLLTREKVALRASGKSGLDQVNFAGPLVGVYSRSGGPRTLWFPKPVEVVADLFSGEILARNAKQFDFETPRIPQTRIFFAGSAADYRYFQSARNCKPEKQKDPQLP